jgi:drug/metabolite transporter (DMT)-like permease
MRMHLVWPLLSSLLYVAGALLVKRSGDWGVGVWRTSFVSNVTTAFCFLPLLALDQHPPSWTLLWQPLVTGLLFMAGQTLAFLALSRGDVSIATPVLGLKTVLVALLSSCWLAQAPSAELWVSSALSALAIALLNSSGRRGGRHVGMTILGSVVAALCFAAFDVLTQRWSPTWGAGSFLPLVFACVAVLSLAYLPLFSQPLGRVPRPAWPWLMGGALLIALQSLVLITTVATWGDATAVNIVYSSRGLWSVLAVLWVGHWVGNQEGRQGSSAMRRRLCGAGVMVAAIILAIIGR